MIQHLCVASGILCEFGGTASLHAAAMGYSRWYFGVIVGYADVVLMLVMSVRKGLPLGVVYGIWTAAAIALAAVAALCLFDERKTRRTIIGIGLVISGIPLMAIGAQVH